MKSKVTMICREIWRATVVIEHPIGKSQEAIKDEAWSQFDEKKAFDLEQENYTKVEEVQDEVDENVKPPEFDK